MTEPLKVEQIEEWRGYGVAWTTEVQFVTLLDSHEALRSEVEVLRRRVAEAEKRLEFAAGMLEVVDPTFHREFLDLIGMERPPEHVFEYFRRVHGIPEPAGVPKEAPGD